MIPFLAFNPYKNETRNEPCDKRDAKVNKYAFCNLSYGYIFNRGICRNSKPTGQDGYKEICIYRKEQNLEY